MTNNIFYFHVTMELESEEFNLFQMILITYRRLSDYYSYLLFKEISDTHDTENVVMTPGYFWDTVLRSKDQELDPTLEPLRPYFKNLSRWSFQKICFNHFRVITYNFRMLESFINLSKNYFNRNDKFHLIFHLFVHQYQSFLRLYKIEPKYTRYILDHSTAIMIPDISSNYERILKKGVIKIPKFKKFQIDPITMDEMKSQIGSRKVEMFYFGISDVDQIKISIMYSDQPRNQKSEFQSLQKRLGYYYRMKLIHSIQLNESDVEVIVYKSTKDHENTDIIHLDINQLNAFETQLIQEFLNSVIGGIWDGFYTWRKRWKWLHFTKT